VDLQKKQSAEAVEGNQDLTARVLDWARDRTEALEGSIPPTEPKPSREEKASEEAEASEEAKASQEPKPSEEPKTKASPRVAVIALDEDTENRGEVHLFEDLQSASRHVETLLEDGLDEHRLAVFNCTQVNVHLSYRAVVHLNDSEAHEDPAA
jgi:hypothetical protein